MTQEKGSRFIGGLEVSPIGLGCMPLSGYPESMAFILDDRDRAIQTIHAALNAGINLFDTSDAYSPSWNQYGHNEKLIAGFADGNIIDIDPSNLHTRAYVNWAVRNKNNRVLDLSAGPGKKIICAWT